MNKKFKLALILFILGFIGILALLSEFLTNLTTNMEESNRALSDLPSQWITILMYVAFPIISLLVAVTVGTLLYEKVNFKLPVLERIVDKNQKMNTSGILPYGIIGGIIMGVLLIITLVVFNPLLPPEFLAFRGNVKTNIVSRLFYGGFTSEIINRFGIMTFLVWVMHKITGKLTPSIYWIAIIIMILIFGLTNLIPGIHATPSTALISYNIILSVVGITIYGWLYWKKGLETAIIAHLLATVIITMGGYLFNI